MKHMEIKVYGDDQVFVGCESLVSNQCSTLFTEDCIDDAFCMLYTFLVKHDAWLSDDKELGLGGWLWWVRKNVDAEAPQMDYSGWEGERWIADSVDVPTERLLHLLQLDNPLPKEDYKIYLARIAEASLQYIMSEILRVMGVRTFIHWQELIKERREERPKPTDMRGLIDLTFPTQKNVKGVVYPNPPKLDNAGGKHD